MRNKNLIAEFDRETGTITRLSLQTDLHQMNFVKEGHQLNQMKLTRRVFEGFQLRNMELVSFVETDTEAEAVLREGTLEIHSCYSFAENGALRVTNRVSSLSDNDIFLERGEWGIAMPFADEYPDAKTCMTHRCHTHIWCGLEGASYICCLKMGEEPDNLGVLVTKGGWESYSQLGVDSNDRGCFVLNPDVRVLCPGETYVLEYEIFPCTGKEDFLKKCRIYKHFLYVQAEQYILFLV